jgi:ubiquitin carboxyl-terminal hydrolase 7
MSAKAGEFLSYPPIKLRFTTTDVTSGSPKSILKRSLNQTIAEIVVPNYINPTGTTVILYEKLDVSIVELETKRSLRVVWTGIHNKEEATHPFLVPKTSTVNDLADHISKLVTLTPSGSQKIRVFEISKDGKTQKEFAGLEMIGNIPESVELYAEVCERRLLLCGRLILFSANSSRGAGSRRFRKGHRRVPLLEGAIANTWRPLQFCGQAGKLTINCLESYVTCLSGGEIR